MSTTPSIPPKMISINSPQENKKLTMKSKVIIQQYLTKKAQELISKKQREKEKKLKLKQIEDEFERKRIKKNQEIERKIVATTQNKNKNLLNQKQKLERQFKRQQQILNKFHYENQQLKEQRYEERKTYDLEKSDLIKSQKLSLDSNFRQNNQKSDKYRSQRRINNPESQINGKLNELNKKIEIANKKQKLRQSELVKKIHYHNEVELNQTIDRANQLLDKKVETYKHKMINKISNADSSKEKHNLSVKSQTQKRKSYETYKFQKCFDKIRLLQQSRQQRHEQLNQKYEKKIIQPKVWNNKKNQRYLEKFRINNQQIQQERDKKSKQILEKEYQRKNRNKILKQKTSNLVKSMQYNTIE